jgi:hypothetical protein
MGKNVGMSQAPLKDLEAWAQATEKEIEDIQAQLAPLEEQMQAAQERLGLIRRLIGLSRQHGQHTGSAKSTPTTETAHLPLGANLEDHLESLLSEAGEPLHISDLRDRLIKRGIPLPGKGDEANIIVRLRRDQDRFTRTGRGMYALASWGLPAAVPTRPKKVRRRTEASA